LPLHEKKSFDYKIWRLMRICFELGVFFFLENPIFKNKVLKFRLKNSFEFCGFLVEELMNIFAMSWND
jgi:hypothetical protein